ncbi:MAG: menaquinone biosynthesis protein [Pelosinus sp.]|nr:menaquinone biosynthesis protein [Pelosinus sp.]
MQPKLGHIEFMNCLPLNYALQCGFGKDLAVFKKTPAELNKMAVDGELDVSPVSSIIYAMHPEKFLLLPHASISVDGAVRSIILMARQPIEKLDKARIFLTHKSATSHALLKIIMHHKYYAAPEYSIARLDAQAGIPLDADAALFIGDDALYVNHHHQEGYYYYDLGLEWKKLTGLQMVYAVWVVNRTFARENPAGLNAVYNQVIGGFSFGLEHRMDMLVSGVKESSFTESQLDEYISLFDYDFRGKHQEALIKYYQMAQRLEVIPALPEIVLAEVKV